MRKSVLTTSAGLFLAIALSVGIGIIWPFNIASPEIASRTVVGLDSVAPALASGAAAALSLTTGLSSVLVGVMVAVEVALLLPAVTVGLMLGHGHFELAVGAGLLLAVNLVCVNLSSKVVFFIKGIRPRGWLEKEKAKNAMTLFIIGWLITLFILMFFIYNRRALITL